MADRKNIVTLGIGASPGTVMWFITTGLESGIIIVYAGAPLVVHAHPTDTLLHAEATVGHFNTIKVNYMLVDEAGDTLVDEEGNILVSVLDDLGVVVLHAHPTDTLLHAEATYG